MVEQVARSYRDEGYEVVLEPSADDLPAFLRDFRPDLVAVGEEESVVVEVKSGATLPRGSELIRMAAVLADQPGWRLDLVSTGTDRPVPADEPLTQSTLKLEEIDQVLEDATTASIRRHHLSALILAALAAEGILRRIGHRIHRDYIRLGPIALAKTLYSEGPLTEKDVGALVALFEMRNRAAHAHRMPSPDSSDLPGALEVVRRLRDWERIRDRIEQALRDPSFSEALEEGMRSAVYDYNLENRFAIQSSGGETNSEALDDLELGGVRIGEIQDVDETSVALVVYARAKVRFVFLFDADFVSEVEDVNFEVQEPDAAEGLVMATTEREYELEFSTWFDAVRPELREAEVVAAEDVTGSPWTWR
jgi:hypothetical protein